MAGSFNKVILMGNLGADPKIVTFDNGGKIANLRLATSESWKDRQSGERKEKTEWHSVVVRGEALVNIVETYLKKGSKVLVEGLVATRKWVNDGVDHYTTEVVVSSITGGLTMISATSGSTNRVMLIGNLGRDPEIRNFQNGGKIANLRLATSESWKDKDTGERKEKTEWHSVVVRGAGVAGIAEKFLEKGSTVLVEGQLSTRKWTDQSGAERYSTEIVVAGHDGKLTLMGGKKAASDATAAEEEGAPADDEIPY